MPFSEKSKEAKKNSNLFKKIMDHRIHNIQKRKDKNIYRNYKTNIEKSPLTIKVDARKFLSNYKNK